MAKKPAQSDLTRWRAALEALIAEVIAWADAEGWAVARSAKQLTESGWGEYEVEFVRLRGPQGEIQIDPIGGQVVGAEGRVDLIAWPSMNRVRLILKKDGEWGILTDSNVWIRRKLNRKTFVDLAHDLTASNAA